MEEVDDRAGAADECRGENGSDSEKECAFDEKVAPRFAAKVFATDVEERRLRTASGTAVIAINRENLEIVICNRKPGASSTLKKIPASANVFFRARFHRF